MAKVKITGHASGSGVFTITAPNSNTDRTITLPDASVTLGADATKLPLAGGALTGAVTTNSTFDGRDVAADGVLATNALPKAGGTITGALTVNAAAVFNETSADVDFRVESNGLTHALFVDGGTNRVGIGTGTPDTLLEVQGVANVGSGSDETLQQWNVGSDNCKMGIKYLDGSGNRGFNIGTITEHDFNIKTNDTNRLKVSYNGRGISQFTAACWVNFNGTGTVAIRDSHNVASVQDLGTGNYYVHIDVNMSNANYCAVNSGNAGHDDDGWDGNAISQAASAALIRVYSTTGAGLTDGSVINVTVFGDSAL